jgi:hypothetical protein
MPTPEAAVLRTVYLALANTPPSGAVSWMVSGYTPGVGATTGSFKVVF